MEKKKRITRAELVEIKHWCVEKQAIAHHVVYNLCEEIDSLRDLISKIMGSSTIAFNLQLSDEAKQALTEAMRDA